MPDVPTFMTPKYQPGDRVMLSSQSDRIGRVAFVSARVGPQGEPVYRVQVGRRPDYTIIALESQLRPAPPKPKPASRPADGGQPAA